MKRSPEEWRKWCRQIEAGYVTSSGKESMYEGGVEFIEQRLRPAALWTPGDLVLEVGSGNGRIAMGLCEEPIRYLGLEPMLQCVEFCRRAIEAYEGFEFRHFDVHNSFYNRRGTIDPGTATFPVADDAVDFVILASVFSHIETTDAASRYLDEIHRVLKPGCKVYCTWFRSPPNDVTTDAKRTVYPASWILDQVHRRFKLWDARSGSTTGFHDQWEMIGIK